MKKFFTFLAILGTLGAGSTAMAQSFSSAHDTIYVTTNVDTNVHNELTVPGFAAVSVKWTLRSVTGSTELMNNISICDNSTCYGNPDVWPNKTVASSYSPGTSDFHLVMDLGSVPPGGPWIINVRLYNSSTPTDTSIQTYIVTRTAGPVSSVSSGVKANTEVSVYPNPASSSVNVVYDGAADIKNIAVYNIIGKQVSLFRPTSYGSANLNIENIPSGVYFVRLLNSRGDVVSTRRFTKQ